MPEPTRYDASPPVAATALLVDLRNFTPNLNAGARGTSNVFCDFLARFYSQCLRACMAARPPAARSDGTYFYLNSTGDGILAVYAGESHHIDGFLAAVVLHNVLKRECTSYNSQHGSPATPPTSFGIGVESGSVSWVRARLSEAEGPCVETCIGDCINVAARADAVSKLIHKANTIIAAETNELCCQTLLGASHHELISRARNPETTDKDRLTLYDQASALNRSLCLAFLENHMLKGVTRPVALFKLGDRSVTPGNPRLSELLAKLTRRSDSHYSEVMALLEES